MCHGTKKAVRLFLLIPLFLCPGSCFGEPDPVELGEHARDFQLKNLDGESFQLSAFKGRIVQLHFWADWCEVCVEEFAALEKAYRKLKKDHQDYELLGINVAQSRAKVEAFIRKVDVPFPILLDGGGKVTMSYGVKGLPSNFLIGRDGIVREIIVGGIDEALLEKSLRDLEAAR